MIDVAGLSPYAIFAAVMAAYLPGVAAALLLPRLAAMPVVMFAFLGMFLFTAAGSFLIMTRPHWALGSLSSNAYVTMLIAQALIFYAVAGPYLWWRKIPLAAEGGPVGAGNVLRAVLALVTVAILAYYYAKVGRFLLFDLVAGRINRVNILEFRALTYGLPEYPLLRLGFFVFPALIAAITVSMASARDRLGGRTIVVLLLCTVPPLLLAEKAAVLHMAAVVFIAYVLHLGDRGLSLATALRGRTLLVVLLAFLPTALTYLVYFSAPGDTVMAAFDQFLFRIVGVYSETMAASVPFVEAHGYLDGTTIPNAKGLFPHERFNLEAAMHAFLAAGSEYRGQAALPGASPVPATAEGYVNFGWPGFVLFSVVAFSSVVAVQEILIRLRSRFGSAAWALSAWYGYLGFTLMTTTVFATFISLIHTVLAAGVLVAWYVIDRLLRRFGRG
jgi:hypothetical protein